MLSESSLDNLRTHRGKSLVCLLVIDLKRLFMLLLCHCLLVLLLLMMIYRITLLTLPKHICVWCCTLLCVIMVSPASYVTFVDTSERKRRVIIILRDWLVYWMTRIEIHIELTAMIDLASELHILRVNSSVLASLLVVLMVIASVELSHMLCSLLWKIYFL